MESIVAYKPCAAVVARREMARTREVFSVLDAAERAVLMASADRTIAEYPSEELTAELNGVLKWIAKDIGYRETDEAERQYIVIRTAEILKRYYPTFSLKDFRMAFETCITGELDEYLPRGRDGQPDRSHYQQFNAEYVCKVLNAYRSRRSAVLRKAEQAMPKKEPVRDAKRDAENADAVRRLAVWAFLHYKYRGHLPELSMVNQIVVYNELVSAGLADELEVTAAEQKAAIDSIAFRLTGRDAGSRGFSRKRTRRLEEAFAWMVENEIQITDYVNCRI